MKIEKPDKIILTPEENKILDDGGYIELTTRGKIYYSEEIGGCVTIKHGDNVTETWYINRNYNLLGVKIIVDNQLN